MPIARVRLPDGRIGRFEVDEGLAPEDVEQYIAGMFPPPDEQLSTPVEQKRTTPATTISGEVLEVLKGIPSGAVGLLQSAATGAAALLPDQAERAVRGQIEDIAGSLREPFEAAAGYEESIGRKAGEALGSTAPFFALGPLGVAGRLGAAGLGVGAGAGEARVRAEQEGGMEERGAATALGALVGATEVVPVFRFADRILNRLPDQDKGLVLEYIKRAAAAGGEEFAQEASANIAQNLIEKGLYNPEQDVFEGAAEEGAYGFGIGAFIQGLTDLAVGRRVRGAVAPPEGEDERTRVGTEQVITGADTRGVELPVSRVGAAGPDVEGFRTAGMGVPRGPARRVDEGEEGVQPPLEPDPISQLIVNRRGASDFARGLYEPDPQDATTTNLDLDEVPSMDDIERAKNYIKQVSQYALQKRFGDEVILYRGLKGTEDKTPVLSYSLDKDTAKFFAEQQGIRSGQIEEIKVPVSDVLSYSNAIGEKNFGEEEILIPTTARQKALNVEPARFQIDEDPESWYYSELARQAERLPLKSATPQQWLATLRNKNVKDEELEYTGFKDWLEAQEGNVSKEDALNYLANNGVTLEETLLGENAGGKQYEVYSDFGDLIDTFDSEYEADNFIRSISFIAIDELDPADMPGDYEGDFDDYRNAVYDFERDRYSIKEKTIPGAEGIAGPVKYSGFRHPFGDNYRELIIRIPTIPAVRQKAEALRTELVNTQNEFVNIQDQISRSENDADYNTRTLGYYTKLDELRHKRDLITHEINKLANENTFQEEHWNEYGRNAIGHMRMSDMNDGKVLMVHEMQSQLAQTGRDRGFVGEEKEPKIAAALQQYQEQQKIINDVDEKLEDLRREERKLTLHTVDLEDAINNWEDYANPRIRVDFVDLFPGAEKIISEFEKGESPYAIFKSASGAYIGLYDFSSYDPTLPEPSTQSLLTKDALKKRFETLPPFKQESFYGALGQISASSAIPPRELRRVREELGLVKRDAENMATQIKEANLETSRGRKKRFDTPRFPFSGSTDKWQNLILKRILKYAADNGYERIMFPQGQEAKSYTMGDLRGQEFFYDVISPKNIKNIVNKYKGKVTFSKVRSPWELESKISAAIKKELEANPSVASAYEVLGDGQSIGKKRRTAFTRLMEGLRSGDIDLYPINEGHIGVGKPNTPEGIETNNAIREFIDAVKTYERESRPLDETQPGEVRTVIEITPEMRSNLLVKLPLFRMGRRTTKGMAVSQVQKVVSELTQGWVNKPNIKVVNTHKDLPKAYRSDKYKRVRGMLLGNDVYIVAANAGSPSEVKATLFHESLGHYGLRGLFGEKLDKALNDIYATNSAIQSQADAWLRKHPDVYTGVDRVARAVEEVLAAKSEAGVIKEPGIRAAFNRLAAMIRKFIRSMGIQLDYTNNDINNILLESAERVRVGPMKLGTPDARPRYQISQYNNIISDALARNATLPQWSQNLGDGVAETLSNLPENLRRGQYYVYSMPHMVELLERYIPRIRAIDRFIGYRASYTTDLMKTAADNHAKYSRVVQGNPQDYDKFKDVVNNINLFQVPVRSQAVRDLLTQDRATLSPQKQKYYDIAKKFYDLPEAFQNSILSADERSGLFADYRKMGDKKFDIFAEVYGGQLGMGVVRDLRERFERERLPMYAPLVRGEGAHWLYYETTDGQVVKQPFSNAAARETEIKRITQEGLANTNTIQRVTRPSEIRQKGPPPVGFLGEIISKLEDKLSDMPEAQRKEIIDGVYDTFLQYLPSNMLRQELTSRQTSEVDGAIQFGVLGFDQDVLAVYDRTMPKMAYQLGNLKFALPIENAMKKILEQAKLYEIAVRDNNIPERLRGRKLMSPKAVFDGVEDMRRRLDFAYNPSYAPWVNAAATANYVYSIAGNISSALINTTVLAMITWPMLMSKYGPVKSIAAMGRAMKIFLEGGVDAQGNFTFGNAASGELKTLFNYLEKRGAIGIAAEQELRQAQRAAISGYESTMDKINFVAGYVFKNSERFNREVTMLASFMLAREKGKGFREAAEEAIRLNNNINGTVLPEQASRMYQTNLGRVILTFRTFALTQIIALSRMFGRALKVIDATPEERSLARKQLLGVYGATYMMAGMKGLPLFGAAEVLAAALMGDDDEPYDLQQEVIDSVGLLGLNGPLNAALQVDIASRTGFNGMLWRDDSKRLAEVGYPLYIAERVAGPTYGLVQSQIRGIENLMDGNVQRGFESILPAPLRNPLKAARYATEGALTKNGLPIVDDVNAWNSTMQIFGFAPAELAATQEQIGATFQISDKLRNRRTALLTNVYAATEAGDGQAMIEAYEAIDKFNAANPSYIINPKSLRASFRERRRRALEAVNGIYLPRNLRMATDALMAEPY
jgi:hypothetical protein